MKKLLKKLIREEARLLNEERQCHCFWRGGFGPGGFTREWVKEGCQGTDRCSCSTGRCIPDIIPGNKTGGDEPTGGENEGSQLFAYEAAPCDNPCNSDCDCGGCGDETPKCVNGCCDGPGNLDMTIQKALRESQLLNEELTCSQKYTACVQFSGGYEPAQDKCDEEWEDCMGLPRGSAGKMLHGDGEIDLTRNLSHRPDFWKLPTPKRNLAESHLLSEEKKPCNPDGAQKFGAGTGCNVVGRYCMGDTCFSQLTYDRRNGWDCPCGSERPPDDGLHYDEEIGYEEPIRCPDGCRELPGGECDCGDKGMKDISMDKSISESISRYILNERYHPCQDDPAGMACDECCNSGAADAEDCCEAAGYMGLKDDGEREVFKSIPLDDKPCPDGCISIPRMDVCDCKNGEIISNYSKR